MVKHTQTIRRQISDELFESVWPFCEIDAKRVKYVYVLQSEAAVQNYFSCKSTNIFGVPFP